MENINKLEYLVDRYLTEKVTKEEFPMIWSYCQVKSEKYRLQKDIIKKMLESVHPNIEATVAQLENDLSNISE